MEQTKQGKTSIETLETETDQSEVPTFKVVSEAEWLIDVGARSGYSGSTLTIFSIQ